MKTESKATCPICGEELTVALYHSKYKRGGLSPANVVSWDVIDGCDHDDLTTSQENAIYDEAVKNNLDHRWKISKI